jgi:Flp pilus assembly protein TadD
MLQNADFIDFIIVSVILFADMGRMEMNKFGIALLVAAAIGAPATARELVADGVTVLPVAYETLRAGQTDDAIRALQASSDLSPRDPSRLINLGSAYARLGQMEEAAAMFRAAATSPIRYDLELADGSYMDSRWAARTALARLAARPRGTVTLARAQ